MTNAIIKYFSTKNISLNFKYQKDSLKTLQRFAQSRYLISLVPSSFSFIVGVFLKNYVTPFLGFPGVEGSKTLDNTNHTRSIIFSRKLHWTMLTNQSLQSHEILT